ncbi:SMG9 [Lepeophtheirus salmonis]|uniref:SMG9 n=1 Tax=Lepeophtheirus salmonis TaxID=72036 RepID=A0A7R8HEK1_LEPSM|nr:SMG9 [Lepeophtheirus salmonis]CAF3029957.1 SMG9 [Lepeophtheirus salmonis]
MSKWMSGKAAIPRKSFLGEIIAEANHYKKGVLWRGELLDQWQWQQITSMGTSPRLYRRRTEDHAREKEESLKPTTILVKPKASSEEHNPEFPTLLQANAVKKPNVYVPSPNPQATQAAESPKCEEPLQPKKKTDPLDALGFLSCPESRCRLVDAKVGFHESGGLLDHLSDSNTEFLVVGVIGSKGAGKSTLLNGIIGSYIFRESDHHIELNADDCTQGIDAWINQDRVIFLDAQPTLNGSFIKDRLSSSNQGKYFSLLNCYLKKESLGEKESLLMTLFLMNICHCLIFVQDYILDPEVLHFLQLAEMLKPSSPTFDSESNKIEYYPNLILFYDSVFAQSSFNVYGGINASLHSNFLLEKPTDTSGDHHNNHEEQEEEEDAYEEFSMPPDLLKQKKDKPPNPPLINLYALTDKKQ